MILIQIVCVCMCVRACARVHPCVYVCECMHVCTTVGTTGKCTHHMSTFFEWLQSDILLIGNHHSGHGNLLYCHLALPAWPTLLKEIVPGGTSTGFYLVYCSTRKCSHVRITKFWWNCGSYFWSINPKFSAIVVNIHNCCCGTAKCKNAVHECTLNSESL